MRRAFTYLDLCTWLMLAGMVRILAGKEKALHVWDMRKHQP
jgi:hypothetical protein